METSVEESQVQDQKPAPKEEKTERNLFESFVFSEKGNGDACGPPDWEVGDSFRV